MTARLRLLLVMAGALLVACNGDGSSRAEPDPSPTDAPAAGCQAETGQRHPDVIAVEADREGDTYSFRVTVSSPYDTPERYADGWRLLAPDGTALAEHQLLHDHASEQPFTREQTGVRIPEGVEEVTVEGRDLCFGYGGGTQTVRLP